MTVVDDWQHMGVATLLLSHLVDRARAKGIRRFSALVQGDNAQVLELIRALGEVRMESQGAELLLDIELPDELSRKRLQATLREIDCYLDAWSPRSRDRPWCTGHCHAVPCTTAPMITSPPTVT